MRPHFNYDNNMIKTKELTDIILRLSDGLVGTITDFLLFQFYLSGELFGAQTHGDISLAFEKARESLKDLNYRKFKRAISYLLENDLVTKKSLDKRKRGGIVEIKITQEGRKRIEEITSSYKETRTWDKKVYLITYDIPEEQRVKRNRLREYLKRIGCGFLQESVWLSPYNPKKIIKDFITENNLGGLVLVSSLGKDGSIGEENLKSLVNRVYKLESLNERYKKFINNFDKNIFFDKITFSFAYYQILNDDPQVPFELLPNDWFGDKAYKRYISKIK